MPTTDGDFLIPNIVQEKKRDSVLRILFGVI